MKRYRIRLSHRAEKQLSDIRSWWARHRREHPDLVDEFFGRRAVVAPGDLCARGIDIVGEKAVFLLVEVVFGHLGKLHLCVFGQVDRDVNPKVPVNNSTTTNTLDCAPLAARLSRARQITPEEARQRLIILHRSLFLSSLEGSWPGRTFPLALRATTDTP